MAAVHGDYVALLVGEGKAAEASRHLDGLLATVPPGHPARAHLEQIRRGLP